MSVIRCTLFTPMRRVVEKIRINQIVSRFILRNHVFSAKVSEKLVAFTFDDGPSPNTTLRLVDLFAKYQGHASFFFQGNHAEQYPDIVKYAHAAGCSVCNHSYDHPLYNQVGTREMLRQIRKTNDILENITGEKVKFLRPPGHRFTQWQSLIIWLCCRQLIVQANITPMDWTNISASTMADFFCQYIKPGAIVCLHDASHRTVEALELALPVLYQQGYSFVSLHEMQRKGKLIPYRGGVLYDLKEQR